INSIPFSFKNSIGSLEYLANDGEVDTTFIVNNTSFLNRFISFCLEVLSRSDFSDSNSKPTVSEFINDCLILQHFLYFSF
ncbi:hypothetical protein, partial [Priestia endophytica]|uniref:hypothetical protein n=1 Tax=Priestia endophytica TaxID=135735 RepID=UPI001A8F260D